MDRKDVAAALEEVAALLELTGENPFKIRAFSQAARTVSTLGTNLSELVADGRVADVKGIGKSIAGHITELVETEELKFLQELKASVPEGLLDMLRIPGLGPKKVKLLHQDLGITNIGQLEYACQENRLVTLKGFGAKTQANILKGIEKFKKYRHRFLWAEIEDTARELVRRLGACPEVMRVEPAGSFRRCKETIKDLDLVAATDAPKRVSEFLRDIDLVESQDAGAETKFTFRLKFGLSCDLRLVPPAAFPFTWHHFTGSKEHNTAMRRLAKSQGLKMNEYGLFDANGSSRTATDEVDVFGLLGLPFIPPELREGLGEVEAAQAGTLPELIRKKDIKGILHVHTDYSDGRLSIAEVTAICRQAGYEYLGLADHSRTAFYAGGLTLEDLERQYQDILKIREHNPGFGLFWGIESDILPDGSLDYPEEILARFDFIIASVHSHFSMPEKEMTARLIKAVQNPFATILGHPTGRLLLSREPYAVNLPAVLEAAAVSNTIVEINANPHRLDLDWREIRRARELGLKMVICPDAHSAEGMTHTRYGVQVARKGWLAPKDVLNCLPLDEMKQALKKRKS